MKITNIEWCDSTVNPTGFQCQGCELWMPAKGVKECYAGRFAERIGGVGAFDQPVVMKPGRMAEAARWSDLRGKERPDKPWIPKEYPRVIFIGDMADTLQRGVTFDYLFEEVIRNVVSVQGRRHIWMWLTKDAKRLEQFAKWLLVDGRTWPANLWPGVSVTSNQTLWRVDHLLKVPAARRFISYEPAWEYVDFSRYLWKGYKDEEGFGGVEQSEAISQIIIGGESGAGAEKHPFNVEWARKLIEDCDDAWVACFVKQLGARPVCECSIACESFSANCYQHFPFPIRHKKGGDWAEWQEYLRVRQFPELLCPTVPVELRQRALFTAT